MSVVYIISGSREHAWPGIVTRETALASLESQTAEGVPDFIVNNLEAVHDGQACAQNTWVIECLATEFLGKVSTGHEREVENM